MRTNIEIDDDFIEKALTATGLKTKRAAVEEGCGPKRRDQAEAGTHSGGNAMGFV
jgi:hypothetical protein